MHAHCRVCTWRTHITTRRAAGSHRRRPRSPATGTQAAGPVSVMQRTHAACGEKLKHAGTGLRMQREAPSPASCIHVVVIMASARPAVCSASMPSGPGAQRKTSSFSQTHAEPPASTRRARLVSAHIGSRPPPPPPSGPGGSVHARASVAQLQRAHGISSLPCGVRALPAYDK